MHNAFSVTLGLIAPLCLAATISNAVAAPPAKAAEDRYIAVRDADDLRFAKIDRKAYDKLGNLRQKGEDEYKRCFTQSAPKQPSFAEATKQAQALLAATMGK